MAWQDSCSYTYVKKNEFVSTREDYFRLYVGSHEQIHYTKSGWSVINEHFNTVPNCKPEPKALQPNIKISHLDPRIALFHILKFTNRMKEDWYPNARRKAASFSLNKNFPFKLTRFERPQGTKNGNQLQYCQRYTLKIHYREYEISTYPKP